MRITTCNKNKNKAKSIMTNFMKLKTYTKYRNRITPPSVSKNIVFQVKRNINYRSQ